MTPEKAEQQARELWQKIAEAFVAATAGESSGVQKLKERVQELEAALRAVLEAPKSKRLAAFKTAQAVLEAKGEKE